MEEEASNVEEERRIDSILPSLRNEGLITDVECRIIATPRNLHAKQSAVHRVIMSKGAQEAARLTEEIFRTLTVTINAEEKSKFQNNSGCKEPEDDSMSPIAQKKNPLLINAVIECLFEFLPLWDIKNCRLVCQQWNSTAEICLRKRCVIHIRPSVLHPETFIKASKYTLPDLPFSAFKFSNDDDSMMRVADLEDFFDKWGKNIKQVEFDLISLENSANPQTRLSKHDATSWFANTTNMIDLKIVCQVCYMDTFHTSLGVSLDKLASVENLLLSNCSILTETNKEYPRIAPLNISLTHVRLQMDNSVCKDLRLNEYFDFSLATNIHLCMEGSIRGRTRFLIFDAGCQILKAHYINLESIDVENWAEAKGDVQYLRLCGVAFVEKNQLKIKKLILQHAQINLSVLPQTIEVMDLSQGARVICTETLQLPNLKQLVLNICSNNSSLLTHFANCSNLLQLHLIGHSAIHRLEILDSVPKSVTTLKIESVKFEVEVSDSVLELDTLILEDDNDTSMPVDYQNVVGKIKPKNLVLVYFSGIDLDTSEIIKLIRLSQNIEKVLIGPDDEADLHERKSFEGSAFSEYVDKESDYYMFENQVGKAITEEEFETWRFLNGEVEPMI